MKETTMSDALDEILFDKKIKKQKKALKETKANIDDLFEKEKDIEDEQDEQDKKDEQENILTFKLRINDEKSIIKLSHDDYQNRAITDFVSAISLFKTSKNLKVKKFLEQLTGSGTPDQQTTPDTNQETPQDETPEEFTLNSFSLKATENISEDNIEVSIVGEENVNEMMSLKVSLRESSTAFNTPESAIAHFNRIFFDNIIQTVDKELEKFNE